MPWKVLNGKRSLPETYPVWPVVRAGATVNRIGIRGRIVTVRRIFSLESYAEHAEVMHNTEPDAGIVNFYQTKDTLMGHVDRSEVCATSPLVSISYVYFGLSGFRG